jgi:hypothetical protein
LLFCALISHLGTPHLAHATGFAFLGEKRWNGVQRCLIPSHQQQTASSLFLYKKEKLIFISGSFSGLVSLVTLIISHQPVRPAGESLGPHSDILLAATTLVFSPFCAAALAHISQSFLAVESVNYTWRVSRAFCVEFISKCVYLLSWC